MTGEVTWADVYHLKGPGIELTYRRRDNKLDIAGDDHLLNQDGLDARATVDPDIGLHLTSTLLESSRNGTRVMLTLLLPEVSWSPEASEAPTPVTGAAIVTNCFEDVVSGPPPVLQNYEAVRRLEGTASPAA
jgi:hypothetical protein